MGSGLFLTPVGEVQERFISEPQIRRVMGEAAKAEAAKNDMATKIAKAVSVQIKEIGVAKRKAIKAEVDWEPQWEAFVKRIDPYEKDFRKKMALYAKDMGARAQDRLEAVMGDDVKKKYNVEDLLDPKEEVASIIQLLTPIYEAILKEEGTSAAELIGAAFDDQDKRMRDALDRSIKLMAQKYNEETLKLLRDALDEGIREDATMFDLRDRVAQVEEFSGSTRAFRVANTETYRTGNFATREAYKQSGVVKKVKWYTAKDEMVCPNCGPLHGETVGIEENFFDKGDTAPVGLKLDYSDTENPPLHPNCRCYIRPEDFDN